MATLVERPFSDSYLVAYSGEHVCYEADHFFWFANLLGKGSAVGGPTFADAKRLNNIMIEGFAIHLRNVIDFLYLNKPQRTDVIAEDFFQPGDWTRLRPRITPTLEAARVRANKEMAHLTTLRMDGSLPEKQWDFDGLTTEIKPLLKLFTANALPARISPNLDAAIR